MLKQDTIVLISIFCDVDDFCKEFEPEWRKILVENQTRNINGNKNRNRRPKLSLSEAITIVTMFHKPVTEHLKIITKDTSQYFLSHFFQICLAIVDSSI